MDASIRRYSPLALIIHLAREFGIDVDVPDALINMGPAGRLRCPLELTRDLAVEQIAACELLLQAVAERPLEIDHFDVDPSDATMNLVSVARVASTFLPEVMWDYQGRYRLTLDEFGQFPDEETLNLSIATEAQTLQAYIAEYDAGEWVDSKVVAGAVANILDAALVVLAYWDCIGSV